MKCWLLLIGFGLLLVAGQPSVTAGDKFSLDNVEYCPLKVGTTWEYLVNGQKVVTTVVTHEMVGDALCARLDTNQDGAVVSEHLTVKGGKLQRLVVNGQRLNQPAVLLQVPPKVDDRWNFAPPQATMTVVEAKKLKIGDREYDTVLVKSSQLKYFTQDVEIQTWYDKEAGMVKQIVSQPAAGINVKVELTKFTPGK
jgi:hypothetical protein